MTPDEQRLRNRFENERTRQRVFCRTCQREIASTDGGAWAHAITNPDHVLEYQSANPEEFTDPAGLGIAWVKLQGRKLFPMVLDTRGRLFGKIYQGPNAVIFEMMPDPDFDTTGGCPCEKCHRKRGDP